jgi:citrate lyase subunit beta / citryl-CoA lyase
MRSIRPPRLCRSWLFLEGANEAVLRGAPASGADVLIQELEDFTPPASRHVARALAADLYRSWREAGAAVVAVRINPLEADGMDDLASVMRGAPDIVALPKVAEPHHVERLDQAVTRFERENGIASGSTALLPNIEFARGLVQTAAIAKASPRIVACLLASEDLAADLNAERGTDGAELAYCRQRFIVECTAANVVAIDCPYTFSDIEGLRRDTRWARRFGYGAKSLVDPAHAAVINGILSPDDEEMRRARKIVAAFEAARAAGQARVEVDGSQVEVPTYNNAKRLLARGEAMQRFEQASRTTAADASRRRPV